MPLQLTIDLWMYIAEYCEVPDPNTSYQPKVGTLSTLASVCTTSNKAVQQIVEFRLSSLELGRNLLFKRSPPHALNFLTTKPLLQLLWAVNHRPNQGEIFRIPFNSHGMNDEMYLDDEYGILSMTEGLVKILFVAGIDIVFEYILRKESYDHNRFIVARLNVLQFLRIANKIEKFEARRTAESLWSSGMVLYNNDHDSDDGDYLESDDDNEYIDVDQHCLHLLINQLDDDDINELMLMTRDDDDDDDDHDQILQWLG